MAKGKIKGNPWRTIWFSPRQTIADIVASDPRYRLWLLAALHGLPMMLHVAQDFSLGNQYTTLGIIAAAILFAAVFGIIGITIGSAFCYWVGTWIGGKSNFTNIRAAVAWSNAPNIISIAIWVILVGFFGESLFNGQFMQTTAAGHQILILSAGVVQFAVAIWALIILICGLAEVQGFSRWRALANVFLAFLLFVAAIWIVVFGLMGIGKLISA